MTRGRGEDGIYLVLYAVLVVGLFTVAALVLDVAGFRSDRRDARLVADLAATAGAADLDPRVPVTSALACRAAWDYVRTNLDDVASAPAPDCTPFAGPCDPAAPRVATVSHGGVEVRISHPVPDGDTLMLAETGGVDETQSVSPAVDGSPCERLGVRIRRFRRTSFGAVAGLAEGTTDVHAVARSETSFAGAFPTVLALDPTACGVVAMTQAAHLAVGDATSPGVVWLDSDATGDQCPAQRLVQLSGGQTRLTASGPDGEATGAILSYALGIGRSMALVADVGSGRVRPHPTPVASRLGRAPFDERYNCRRPDCAPAHIDTLVARLGAPGDPLPLDFVPFPDCSGAVQPTPGTSYLLTCPSVSGALTFTGDVLVAGDLVVDQNACLALNSTACGGPVGDASDRVLYVRGRLRKAPNAQLHLLRTFTHLFGGAEIPRGSGVLRWTAPDDGPFQNLLVWTETAETSRIGQQGGGTSLVGALFAPGATVQLDTVGDLALAAQLAARRITAGGNGTITLAPDRSRSVLEPVRVVRLIR